MLAYVHDDDHDEKWKIIHKLLSESFCVCTVATLKLFTNQNFAEKSLVCINSKLINEMSDQEFSTLLRGLKESNSFLFVRQVLYNPLNKQINEELKTCGISFVSSFVEFSINKEQAQLKLNEVIVEAFVSQKKEGRTDDKSPYT